MRNCVVAGRVASRRTVSRFAPGPVIVTESVTLIWPLVRLMVCGVLNRELKTIVSAVLGTLFA
jgi:hypothetical protein